jgi:hypothetical protein
MHVAQKLAQKDANLVSFPLLLDVLLAHRFAWSKTAPSREQAADIGRR